MRKTISIGFLAALLALAGCDDGNGDMDPDGGTPVDDGGTNNGGDDGGTNNGDDDGGTNNGGDGGAPPVGACEGARVIELEMGEQTVTGDTTGMSSPRTLTDFCTGQEPSPQELLAFVVPGTGEKTVTFDLAVEGTDPEFDTLVEVRPAGCDSDTDAACFDDVLWPDEVRSSGHFVAEGGSTVHLVVSGFSWTDEPVAEGPWTMKVNVVESPQGPTLTGGEMLRVGTDRYDFLIDGNDPGADINLAVFRLLDEEDNVVGYDHDDDPSTPDLTWIAVDFDVENEDFEQALIQLEAPGIAAETAAAVKAEFFVIDRFGYESNEITIPIRDLVGRGESCGERTVCVEYLECTSGTCATPAATLAACEAATMLTVTETTPASTNGVLEPGEPSRLFAATCDDWGWGTPFGPEDLYTVTVPEGAFDLIASTDNEATGDADTFVYIQTECGNEITEVACNDDSGDAYRSTAVVENATAGTYTIAVEIWGGPEDPTPYQLDVRLRPVIGAGEACDPAEVENRCSTGACPSEGDPICPDPAP